MFIVKSITAGLLIGIGGLCYLMMSEPILGALMFSAGLLVICTTGQNLYTGKVCCITDWKDALLVIPMLILNLATAYGFGWAMHYLKPGVADKAFEMCSSKLNEGITVIPLAVLCNILIYFAVECFNQKQTIGLIMCVMAFILCGFEHCVANAFYFGASAMYGVPVAKYMGLNVLGNTIGGLMCCLFKHIRFRSEISEMQKELGKAMKTLTRAKGSVADVYRTGFSRQ